MKKKYILSLVIFSLIIFAGLVSAQVGEKQYLVKFKESSLARTTTLETENFKRIGEDLVLVKGINREELELREDIEYFEEDYKVHALGETPWNFEVVGFNFSEINESFGEGIKIAILDTGVNYNFLNVHSGYDFVNLDNDAIDDNGHGTFIAYLMRSNGFELPLKGSEVYAVKVLNGEGEGYDSDIIEGINWAISHNIDIISMSFGGPDDSVFLAEALNNAYNNGVLLVAASGNDNSQEVLFPAGYSSVISTGSINQNLARSSFSNYGSSLELVAPGDTILVSDGFDDYLVDGTSFSVPHVVDVAAAYWSQNLGLNNIDVRNLLITNAIDLGQGGRDDFFGYGLVHFMDLDLDNDGVLENLTLVELDISENTIYQNLEILGISDGSFNYGNQLNTFSIISFENELKASQFMNNYLGTNLEVVTGENEILWLSGKNIISLDSEDFSIALKLSENYPLSEDVSFVDYSTSNFEILESCWCGITNLLCNNQECWNEGQSCYLNGFGICVDGSGLSNGDDSFCRYREQRFQGCLLNQFDCDHSNECSSGLFCISSFGSSSCSGIECGCCLFGQIWDSSSNSCFTPQSINSVSWSTDQANTGDTVQLRIFTTGYSNGQQVEFKIWEEDTLLDGGDIIDDPQPSKFGVINNDFASVNWVIPNGEDGLGGNLEYYFKAKIGNTESAKSSVLFTKFGHNGWDCDQSDEIIGGQCASNLPFSLVCDGNTPGTDTEIEGCCRLEENWNNQNRFCNDAVSGKIYSVTQNGDVFNEAPYGNLRLRVFIAEDDFLINPDNVVKSFDIFSNSQGDFAFNPEREINSWNWDAGYLAKYYIHSIYVIEGNEVIGRWTNQFSDDSKYQDAIESVNQIVRIHRDKMTWRKVPEFPEIDPLAGLSLSIQSINEQSADIQKPVHLKWLGKLSIDETGEYYFNFNVTGNVLLKINDEEIINSNINGLKEGIVNLNTYENNVTFEFFESGNHNPKIYWRFGDGEIKEITKGNLIRESTKTTLIGGLNQLTSLSFSEANNQPDYMISFLEKPETLRNQKPLILVHGKHGESGYWGEGDAQNIFNNVSGGGYDAWEFYYPGDDYIDKSGALLGDAINYLKNHNYGSNQKIDVVTHSMGGLVARSYVQNISGYGYKNDVDHLVMIGSPNYGAGSALGIAQDWEIAIPTLGFNTSIPYWVAEETRLNGVEWLLSGNWAKDHTYSPIYGEMSLGSELLEKLQEGNLSQKSLVIMGNKDSLGYSDLLDFNIESILCSSIDNVAHVEADSSEHDCLVAITSSSLLSKNVPLAIISNKNHVTEISDIEDYSILINEFLNDASDNSLRNHAFVEAYNNPNTNSKKNFGQYDEGGAMIKINSSSDLGDLTLKDGTTSYKFSKNPESDIYYHFNRGEFDFIGCVNQRFSEIELNLNNPLCLSSIAVSMVLQEPYGLESCVSGYNNVIQDKFDVCLSSRPDDYALTIPVGSYEVFLDNVPKNSFIQINPMETTFFTVNLQDGCIPSIVNTSWSDWQNISCLENGLMNQSRYLVQYDSNNCGLFTNETIYESRTLFSCDIEENFLTINSPSQSLFDERRVQFNLTATEEMDEITYIDNTDERARERRLCRNCDEYGLDRAKYLSFSDGFHNVTIKAIKNGEIIGEENAQFRVDTKKPRISSSEPRRGFASGTFSVKFREDNPAQLTLFYGNRSYEVDLESECLLNRGNYECETAVDLSGFDGEEIEYYFVLEDIAGNMDSSRVYSLEVDATPPVINSLDFSIDRRRVDFSFNVTEENFDEIDYIDFSDSIPRERRLCSRLRDGVCEVRKSFRTGEHNLTITVLDDAGNFVSQDLVFGIE